MGLRATPLQNYISYLKQLTTSIKQCIIYIEINFLTGEKMDYKKLLMYTADLGEKLLVSGAEVGRVEDTVTRILNAYDASRVDVFTITSTIIVSARWGEETHTQTRRIKTYKTNFKALDAVNALSRYICENKPDAEYIKNQLDLISEESKKEFIGPLVWALVAGVFTVFFGGDLRNGLVSATVGAVTKISIDFISDKGINSVFLNVIASFVVSFLAYLSVMFKIGTNADIIIIGNIMLLIPGIAFTNSIRDVITGDIIAGGLRFFEALMIAVAIAAGYTLTVLVFGGVI